MSPRAKSTDKLRRDKQEGRHWTCIKRKVKRERRLAFLTGSIGG